MTDDNKPYYLKLQNEQLIPTNVPDTTPPVQLSEKARQFITQWIKRYPQEQKRSGIFEALRFVQEENNGSLTPPLMDAVADFLNIPHVAAYEVAAFYSMYHLNPVGKHVIHVCTNISCSLNGAEKIVEHLKSQLQIDFNQTTADGRFTLKESECLGACIAPPVCLLDKTYHEHVTTQKIDEMLALHRGANKDGK